MKYSTAGESHGHGILALIEQFPAGFRVETEQIDAQLRRRQGGYGRGGRQKIETDRVEILTGLWQGITTGAPITLWIENKDCRIDAAPEIPSPRPGHVDLAGSVKYGLPIRPIMERASARETAGRVAAGALAQQFLASKGITVIAFVRSIGQVSDKLNNDLRADLDEKLNTNLSKQRGSSKQRGVSKNDKIAKTSAAELSNGLPAVLLERRSRSELYSIFPENDAAMKKVIDAAAAAGDTLGGIIECHVFGVPIGLGSHVQWNEKLDGLLAQAVMSIQGIKGVEIGLGFDAAKTFGSEMHDPISFDLAFEESSCRGFVRPSNRAGGIEGGISNGAPIVLRAAMKPIPTMKKPLQSIDMKTKQSCPTIYERSDVCAVPAASVVVETAVAATIMSVFP
ncbi:MAG: chorismate synthase [Thermoguttaceae bacterium]